jgi:hypothetical protein
MTLRSLAAVWIGLGAAHPGDAQDPAAIAVRDGVARNIFVTVVDDKGVPPSDLTLQDVEIKEDGAVRKVLAVKPATSDFGFPLPRCPNSTNSARKRFRWPS